MVSQKTYSRPTKPDEPKNSSGRVLLIINADTSKQAQSAIDRSQERLADYTALKNTLPADILDWNEIDRHGWTKIITKVGGKGVALATLAFTRRDRYQAFYCDSENNGLVLALLFKVSRTRRPLLTIGHWITPSKKAVLFKRLAVHSHITTLFLHSSTQYQKAVDQLGIPAHKLQLIPYQVDTEFWRSEHAQVKAADEQSPYICTAGLEFRDYPTLIEAVRDLPVNLKIGAASYWSKREDTSGSQSLPANVEVRAYNYHELRDLYAGSRFVVVPLYDTDFQAGITVILEAMAMGKAVIVTRSEGQGDTVVDKRKTLRINENRQLDTIGQFTRIFGPDSSEEADQTGFYVRPGDVAELRRAISFLLAHPLEAAKMGHNGRHAVEKLMSVEHFAERIGEAVLKSYDYSD